MSRPVGQDSLLRILPDLGGRVGELERAMPNLVGLTNTQTLTNKIIQNPLIEGRRVATSQKTANYTVVPTDEVIPVSASGGDVVITLPSAALNGGKVVTIKKIDSSTNKVEVQRLTGTTDTFDGGATSFGLRSQFATVTLIAGIGGGWGVISQSPGLSGTALPASAFDGQQFRYAADQTNGIVWPLVYRSAEATYKWIASGMPLMSAQGLTTLTATTVDGTFRTLASDATLTPPLSGDYYISLSAGVRFNFGPSTNAIIMELEGRLAYNGTIDNTAGSYIYAQQDVDFVDADKMGHQQIISRKWRKTGITGGQAITPRWKASGNTTISVERSVIEILPIRVI